MEENSVNANEYLANKRKEIEENEIKNKARKKRFNIGTIIFICIVVLFAALTYAADKVIIENKYNDYMEKPNDTNTDEYISTELVEYKNAYAKFEEDQLGNKGNNIMNYGLVCPGKDFIIYNKVSNSKSKLVLLKNNVENVISDLDAEYINTDNEYIYYVNKFDKSIYKNDTKGNEQQLVQNISSGEMLLYNRYLYFINNTDNQNIYKVEIEGQSLPEKTVSDTVVKFVISGNNIIYIDDNNVIKKYDMTTDTISVIHDKIENFCYNGSILALNNGKIISFNSFGNNAKVLKEDNISLLNSDVEYIYYSKDNKLYEFDISTDNETELTDENDIYKAVYKVDSKLFYYVLNKNSDNIYEENLLIKDIQSK